MSKVSTSTESNLKTARYKTSGSLVKNNQFSSRDKVMEVRTHAAHIKVKSYNSLIKNNSLSQSWYNNNTSSKSIQSEFKLNKRKWQPRNEAKLYDENTPEQNKSRYLTKKEEQQKLKRIPAYKRAREEDMSADTPINDSHSKIAQQTSKRKTTGAYKQQRTDKIPEQENFNNGIIRVTIPQHSIVNPASNVTQVIRLSEDRENNHLLKVRSFKLISDEPKFTGNRLKIVRDVPAEEPIGNTRYSHEFLESNPKAALFTSSVSNINKKRLRLVRNNHLINEADTIHVPYSRYSFSNNGGSNSSGNGRQLLQRRIKLNRMKQHTIKEGQIINSTGRYTTSNNIYESGPLKNTSNSLKNLSRKEQFNRIGSTLNQATQSVSRNEEETSFGNKITHQSINQAAKLPAYKATGKQVIGVLDESRKNIEGVFSQKKSITQMLTNTDESRKHINVSSSIHKSIKNLDGNGDLGIDTVVQTKNALLNTEKTLRITSRAIKNTPRYTKKTISGLKKSVQAVKWTSKAVKHPIQTTKHLIMATKIAFKSLLNPIVLKGILIFSLIAVILFSCIATFSGITSVYAALTYTSEAEDLDESWKKISKMDAELLHRYYNIENEFEWKHIHEFHYFMNYYPYTDINQVIAYLTTKYDEFTFAEVNNELIEIHNEMYNLHLEEWVEKIKKCVPVEGGGESCAIYEIYHLDVTLNGMSFEEWLDNYGELKKEQRERYDTTLEIGGITMLAEFGNPFGREEWFPYISERYGYKYDSTKKEVVFHNGIDLSKQSEVKSISSGVVETGSDEEGGYLAVTKYGKKDIKIKYYNLSSQISPGQKIKKGDLIGISNGNLQISYELNGRPYNPWFYMEGGYGTQTSSSSNNSITPPSFIPEIVSKQGWAWPTQSTRITSQFGYRKHPITGENKLHAGIDIGRITNSDVIQTIGVGTVTFAGHHRTGGNMVVIDHGNGVQSYYMHLDSMAVNAGDTLDISQPLGIMGNTGGSTGIHLHFEIRINGNPVDPLKLFNL